jgi:hypothetical protein
MNVKNLSLSLEKEHDKFKMFVGKWAGESSVWADPSGECWKGSITSEFQLLVGGLFLFESYSGLIKDTYHEGHRMIGHDKKKSKISCTWLDSWHNDSSAMICEGDSSECGLSFTGYFHHGDQKWGWETQMSLHKDDHLEIRQYTISPEGERRLGVESKLIRQ